jgi:hypothetical protein
MGILTSFKKMGTRAILPGPDSLNQVPRERTDVISEVMSKTLSNSIDVTKQIHDD